MIQVLDGKLFLAATEHLVVECSCLQEPYVSMIAAHDAAKRAADGNVGKWLSAALDDPAVCPEMKADIQAWFKAHE